MRFGRHFWNFFVQPRRRLRDAALVIALMTFEPDLVWMPVGLGVFAAGCGLHLWSKGVLTRHRGLTTAGPYRYVRHPFYLGSILIDMGICAMAGNTQLLMAYLPVSLLLYGWIIRREDRQLRRHYGQTFKAYRAAVPALVSWRVDRLAGPLDFSWNRAEQEHEITRLLRILAIPSYFMMVYAAFHMTDSDRIAMLAAGAVMALALHACSFAARPRHHRRHRLACG